MKDLVTVLITIVLAIGSVAIGLVILPYLAMFSLVGVVVAVIAVFIYNAFTGKGKSVLEKDLGNFESVRDYEKGVEYGTAALDKELEEL